jgi:hypothetical protein
MRLTASLPLRPALTQPGSRLSARSAHAARTSWLHQGRRCPYRRSLCETADSALRRRRILPHRRRSETTSDAPVAPRRREQAPMAPLPSRARSHPQSLSAPMGCASAKTKLAGLASTRPACLSWGAFCPAAAFAFAGLCNQRRFTSAAANRMDPSSPRREVSLASCEWVAPVAFARAPAALSGQGGGWVALARSTPRQACLARLPRYLSGRTPASPARGATAGEAVPPGHEALLRARPHPASLRSAPPFLRFRERPSGGRLPAHLREEVRGFAEPRVFSTH